MKAIKFFVFVFLTAMLSMAVLQSCEKVDFPEALNGPIDEVIDDLNSQIIIKTSTGYATTLGQIYVEKNVATGFKVEARPGATSPITEATWSIEGNSYEGLQIWHKFTGLGQIPVSVMVKFQNGQTENRTINVYSVVDMSTVDPIQTRVLNNNNGTYTVSIYFDRSRVRMATDTLFQYIGTVSGWQPMPIPWSQTHYVINPSGQVVTVNDVGKYIGVHLTMTESMAIHSIALIHSVNNWTDFSGSAFVKQSQTDLVLFSFYDGEVIPMGDTYAQNLPGETGDAYFRFTQTGDTLTGKVNLYFKLASNFTTTSFAVRQLLGGTYTSPIQLYSVPGFEQWGQMELPIGEMYGKVSAFRYGPNNAYPTTYSTNMNKSFFYDPFFKDLRVLISKVY